MELFPLEIPVSEAQKTQVNITTTILFYSDEELKEFKKLCKAGIKEFYGAKFQEGNYSDLILNLLREKYGKNI